MSREVTVYRKDPTRACFDFETRSFIDGTEQEPQSVSRTVFVQQKLKSGDLVEVSVSTAEATNPPTVSDTNPPPTGDLKPTDPLADPLTVEQFAVLSAAEQKAELERLSIEGDASNEEKRIALYSAHLEAQPE